jgi:glycosyltransferase involved in cell wall biosynthesis
MSSNVFVPRLMDDENRNSQCKNAQAIVGQWRSEQTSVRTICYHSPAQAVAQNPRVQIHRLWRRHLWSIDLFRQYLLACDLIFNPGSRREEMLALKLRGKTPIVTTIEGLMGNEDDEQQYAEWAGHPVYCQRSSISDGLERWNRLYSESAKIIAISPFLARMGEKRYGNKITVLPLGIDTECFHARERSASDTVRVVTAGRLEGHKRPEVFVELARRHPQAEFHWYGEGSLRIPLMKQAECENLRNLSFPGSLPPSDLGGAFRKAHIFAMPSKSEGVPKVTQEAAACGLAQVIFGFYEAPSVIEGKNGKIVWDDERFYEAVDLLVNDVDLTRSFGERGAAMARESWDWDVVAPQWEQALLDQVR